MFLTWEELLNDMQYLWKKLFLQLLYKFYNFLKGDTISFPKRNQKKKKKGNKRKHWWVQIVHIFINISYFISIRKFEVDFVLLAGYLKLIPVELIRAYPRSILNIHPSLLPAFGGKGYYGMKVHKAVIASGARYLAVFDVYVSEPILFPD